MVAKGLAGERLSRRPVHSLHAASGLHAASSRSAVARESTKASASSGLRAVTPTTRSAAVVLTRSSTASVSPTSSGPLDAPLITAKIREASNLRQLELVVLRNQEAFNHINLSACFVQLQRLVTGRVEPMRKAKDTDQAAAFDLLNMSPFPFSSLESMDDTDMELNGQYPKPYSTLNPLAIDPLAQSPPENLPAESSTPKSEGPSWDSAPPVLTREGRHVLQLLINMVPAQLYNMDVQGIVNTVYSLAQLRHKNLPLLESLLSAIEFRLDMCSPQNLSNLIVGVVYLQHTPNRHWMRQYYSALESKFEQFGPRDVAMTMWAFGRLQHQGGQYKLPSNVVNLMLQMSYKHMELYNHSEVAICLWGCARLGFTPGPAWSSQFFSTTFYRLSRFRAADLSLLGWSLGQLGLTPEPFWMVTYFRACHKLLSQFTASQLCQLMSGIEMLGIPPPEEWSAAALSVMESRLTTMPPRELVNCLRSTVNSGTLKLDTPLGAQWIQQWLQAVDMHMASSSRPQAAVRVTWEEVPASSSGALSDASVSSNKSLQVKDRAEVNGSHASGSRESSPSDPSSHVSSSSGVSAASSSSSRSSMTGGLDMNGYDAEQVNGWHAKLPEGSSANAVGLESQMLRSGEESSRSGLDKEDSDGLGPSTSSRLNPVDLCMALHSLAHLRIRPDDAWMLHLLGCLNKRMDTICLQPNLVAMVAWSLSRLRVKPPSDWVESFLQSTGRRMQRGTKEQLMLMLYVVSSWGLHCDAASSEVYQWWMARFWWRSLVLLKRQELQPTSMCIMLTALLKMGLTPHSTWMRVCHKAIHADMMKNSYTARQLSTILKSLAVIGAPLPSFLRRSCLAASFSMRDDLTAGDWGRILWSLMRLQVPVPADWVSSVLEATLPHLKASPGQRNLMTLLASCVKLGGQPSEMWMTAWFRASETRLRMMDPHTLCTIIDYLAQLHARQSPAAELSQKWVAAYLEASMPQLDNMSDEDITRMVCSLNVLGAMPPVTWIQALVVAVKSRGFADLTTELRMVKGVMAMRDRLAQQDGVRVKRDERSTIAGEVSSPGDSSACVEDKTVGAQKQELRDATITVRSS